MIYLEETCVVLEFLNYSQLEDIANLKDSHSKELFLSNHVIE
jgi:hypothetical protein